VIFAKLRNRALQECQRLQLHLFLVVNSESKLVNLGVESLDLALVDSRVLVGDLFSDFGLSFRHLGTKVDLQSLCGRSCFLLCTFLHFLDLLLKLLLNHFHHGDTLRDLLRLLRALLLKLVLLL